MLDEDMLSVLSVLIVMLTHFYSLGTLEACKTDDDCDGVAASCIQVSNIKCSCLSPAIHLKQCNINSRRKYADTTSAVYAKLILEEHRSYNRQEMDMSTEPEKEYPAAVSTNSRNRTKETDSLNLTMNVMGLTLSTFLGLFFLICMCCIASCLGIAALFYFARCEDTNPETVKSLWYRETVKIETPKWFSATVFKDRRYEEWLLITNDAVSC